MCHICRCGGWRGTPEYCDAARTPCSHAAVCELLERLGAERSAELVRVRQQLQQAQAGAKAKPGKGVQQPPQPVLSAVVSAAPQEPSYAPQPEAPAVLGFGACKGMGQLVALPPGGVGPVPAGAAPGAAPGEVPPTPPPCVGLAVQVSLALSCHMQQQPVGRSTLASILLMRETALIIWKA